jgi:hypothetical protein
VKKYKKVETKINKARIKFREHNFGRKKGSFLSYRSFLAAKLRLQAKRGGERCESKITKKLKIRIKFGENNFGRKKKMQLFKLLQLFQL